MLTFPLVLFRIESWYFENLNKVLQKVLTISAFIYKSHLLEILWFSTIFWFSASFKIQVTK